MCIAAYQPRYDCSAGRKVIRGRNSIEAMVEKGKSRARQKAPILLLMP